VEQALGQPPFGLITDVDGTISPTVPTPQEARVSPLCHRYLSILSRRLALVAAISGRPSEEARNMVAVPGMVYFGNHGLERWAGDHTEVPGHLQHYRGVINSALEALSPQLKLEGISIENKGITATIHYRLSPDPKTAERHILAAVENSPRARKLRLMPQRMAIALLPPVAVNKGTVIRELIQEYELQAGIYLGDDVTDIYGFRAIRASRDLNFQGLAIGIVSEEMPEDLTEAVDFTLNGVSDVERFLKWMTQTVPPPV